MLPKQTAANLKAYCRHHRLPTDGLKKVLVERVLAHMSTNML